MDPINENIACNVNSCAYHREHHCTLNSIKVSHSCDKVSAPKETQCASFQLGDHGTDCGCR